MTGEYEARDESMVEYLKIAKDKCSQLREFEISHVGRFENQQVDALSKLASSAIDGKPRTVFWELLTHPSINLPGVQWIDRSSTWMGPVISYLADGTLPEDEEEAIKLMKRVSGSYRSNTSCISRVFITCG